MTGRPSVLAAVADGRFAEELTNGADLPVATSMARSTEVAG
jgi:hypothetical protein